MAPTANLNDKPSTTTTPNSIFSKTWKYINKEATFFRVHLFAFTVIPLIASSVFFACNGRYHISFVNSLFLCYSAMAVCGLTPVNLSTLTAWQQVILYLLMMIGDVTVVSWIMVLVRKHYFRTKCEYIVARRPAALHRNRTALIQSISSPINVFKQRQEVPHREKPKDLDDVPELTVTHPSRHVTLSSPEAPFGQRRVDTDVERDGNKLPHSRRLSTSRIATMPSSTTTSRAVDFGSSTMPSRERKNSRHNGVPFPKRTPTFIEPNFGTAGHPKSIKFQNFGGFPGPFHIVSRVAQAAAPGTYRQLTRKLTIPQTQTLDEKHTPWLDFHGLVVGRNSNFHTESLSDEELETIGGAEYKALRVLSYLVPIYFLTAQSCAFLLFGPAVSVGKQYDSIFESQYRIVAKPWFALFQVMAAYTGGGLSLVDKNMLPFQTTYLMIFGMILAILAGNHCLPIFLRLLIWIGSKVTRQASDMHQAFSFLLDHPRRCFIYLFPSHQTWFLVICLLGFSALEWGLFETLNIGLPAFETLPKGTRVVCGLFQGIAARASGFSIVSLASFAPALQFLYIVMMYIAVYPLAMSIRATNVYEERSLGVYETPPANDRDEPSDLGAFAPRERVGRYLNWHLRRQLSIDLWWIVWGVFLVAIIERGNLMNEDMKWFDMFRVLFELVSAFGGIGLSLGVPYNDYSFVGAMRPLSKLVVIVIMVRGRHRGLPVAVDRAVLLPSELVLESKSQHGGETGQGQNEDRDGTNDNEKEKERDRASSNSNSNTLPDSPHSEV